jgi:hypothetical protein
VTGPDLLSDALVASLQAAIPADALVMDHEALPMKVEHLPVGGVFGVFLFQDAPDAADGTPDGAGRHRRRATFKVELRIPKQAHLLHGTQAGRRLIVQAVQADATFGGLANNAWVGPIAVLVHESNSTIACAAVDVVIDYTFDPEAA